MRKADLRTMTIVLALGIAMSRQSPSMAGSGLADGATSGESGRDTSSSSGSYTYTPPPPSPAELQRQRTQERNNAIINAVGSLIQMMDDIGEQRRERRRRRREEVAAREEAQQQASDFAAEQERRAAQERREEEDRRARQEAAERERQAAERAAAEQLQEAVTDMLEPDREEIINEMADRLAMEQPQEPDAFKDVVDTVGASQYDKEADANDITPSQPLWEQAYESVGQTVSRLYGEGKNYVRTQLEELPDTVQDAGVSRMIDLLTEEAAPSLAQRVQDTISESVEEVLTSGANSRPLLGGWLRDKIANHVASGVAETAYEEIEKRMIDALADATGEATSSDPIEHDLQTLPTALRVKMITRTPWVGLVDWHTEAWGKLDEATHAFGFASSSQDDGK